MFNIRQNIIPKKELRKIVTLHDGSSYAIATKEFLLHKEKQMQDEQIFDEDTSLPCKNEIIHHPKNFEIVANAYPDEWKLKVLEFVSKEPFITYSVSTQVGEDEAQFFKIHKYLYYNFIMKLILGIDSRKDMNLLMNYCNFNELVAEEMIPLKGKNFNKKNIENILNLLLAECNVKLLHRHISEFGYINPDINRDTGEFSCHDSFGIRASQLKMFKSYRDSMLRDAVNQSIEKILFDYDINILDKTKKELQKKFDLYYFESSLSSLDTTLMCEFSVMAYFIRKSGLQSNYRRMSPTDLKKINDVANDIDYNDNVKTQ